MVGICELLEERRFLSAAAAAAAPLAVGTIKAYVKQGTLNVIGTPARDAIVVVNGKGGRILVATPKKGGALRTLFSFKGGRVVSVNVECGAGNDYVDLHKLADRPTVVEGGSGDDFVLGGNEVDFVYGNGGNDEVHANGGNDRVYGGAGDDVLLGGDGD